MNLKGPMSDEVELLSESAFKPRIDPEVPLPNQLPVTGEIRKSSAICNATVKWKSKISSVHASARELAQETNPPPKPANDASHQESLKKPEVVITTAGSQSDLQKDVFMDKTDGDNQSQNSTRTRHSRPGSRSDSRRSSRSESRFSQASGGRVASALIAMGTGASFTDIPGGGNSAVGEAQFTKVNTLNNGLLAAVPYLPVPLAWILLFLNIFVPGLGTVLAGISMLCCGSQQETTKQDDMFGACCTNIFVGVSQLFTVTFLLIGWIWSITWGVYMVIFAYERKHEVDEDLRLTRATTVANAFKAGRSI